MQSRISKSTIKGNHFSSYSINAYNYYYDKKCELKHQVFHKYYTDEHKRNIDFPLIKDFVVNHKIIPLSFKPDENYINK